MQLLSAFNLLLFITGPFLVHSWNLSRNSSTSTININSSSSSHTCSSPISNGKINRRDSLLNLAQIVTTGSILITAPSSVLASGGATAGGAYLLSAKQRYNARVSAGVKAYLAIGADLEKGNLDAANEFFSTPEVGGFADFGAAGYLLANAFRRSSSTAPDSLPSVKKWKAFKAIVDELEKKVSKKKLTSASDVWSKGKDALDLYLEEVELPTSMEI